MKKFLMVTPQQRPGQLYEQSYEPMGNELLSYGPTHFPVVPLMHGYTQPGDVVKVVTVTYDLPNCHHNLGILRDELAGFSRKTGIECAVESVAVPFDDGVGAALGIFQQLIDRIDDGDELYACITFGSKVMPLVLTMALSYAYRLKDDVTVECVVYGQQDYSCDPPTPRIYDVTALVKLDELVRVLADRKVTNPQEVLRQILRLPGD